MVHLAVLLPASATVHSLLSLHGFALPSNIVLSPATTFNILSPRDLRAQDRAVIFKPLYQDTAVSLLISALDEQDEQCLDLDSPKFIEDCVED